MTQTLPAKPDRHLRFWIVFAGAMLLFLFLIRAILLPFVVGMLAAYFLDPAADYLERRGMSRTTATAIITGGAFTLTIVLIALLAPLLYQQLAALVNELPGYASQLRQHYLPKIQSLLRHVGNGDLSSLSGLSESAAGYVTGFIGGVLKSGAAVLNLLSLLLITPVVTFYLLRDWDKITHRIETMLPRQHVPVIMEQVREIDRTLAGFLRGQLNACFMLGTFYALALTVAGLKFGALIGLLAGLLIIVPYAGTIVSGLLAVGVAYIQFDELYRVGIIAAIFIVGQMLEGYVITPKMVGGKVGLHPVWLIFGMLSGGALFGFVGVLLAVPATAVIGVLVRFSLSRYLQSGLYFEDNAKK